MNDESLSQEELCKIACTLRFRLIRTAHLSGIPHLASCLSCLDILIFLYWRILRIDPRDSCAMSRDRFILSKGHAAPALFQVLAEKGFYSLLELEKFGQDGTFFGEHPPAPNHLPGIEAATGSLGHGLPMAVGMALAAKLRREKSRVMVLLGDGECNEGSIWEAAMLAASQKLSNLTVFVDYNKWQATGRSEEIMALAPLVEKWRTFGWVSTEVDGHDFKKLQSELDRLYNDPRPKAIICNTIKGKGIDFMEDDNNWHYRIPNAEIVLKCARILGIPHDQIQLDGRVSKSHD